jgi:hypothetical protein
MANKEDTTTFYKRLLRQISGDVDENHIYIPEYCIIGTGDMWCYDPSAKTMVRVHRGSKIYILSQKFDYKGRHLVYTADGLTICIDPEEIILTGCD